MLAAIVALGAAGCGTSSPTGGGQGGVIEVVAAENFWGSVAAQVGGGHVRVTSIISDPNADPHSYEPTASDGRAVAMAGLIIDNGLGYDPWAPKLLSTDPGRRSVVDVGKVLGLHGGANPHRWYNPGDVQRVTATLSTEYSKIDPGDAGYFRAQAEQFDRSGLASYTELITEIKDRFNGTVVGASESIFSLLAPALGLKVITPYPFLKAISEGSDPSAADKATIDSQIRDHRIKLYVYNSQNTTPDVNAQVAECRAAGIPTATITETLTPAGSTYQAWQSRQLRGILDALSKAASR
ncbi:MAG: zinc ABC transporter substrate-binding protein [Actinomycetota bacterium]|nr:zinc ABC transporter substrate-binding protein [Actinomycetota bacterium]